MVTEYTRPVDLDQAVPLGKLAPWLRDHLPDLGPDLDVQQLAGGASNLTFRVSDGTHDLVLRRPPLKGGLATAHDMGREFRVQHGLADTSVPVAPMVALCDDDTVIGVPFYVMGWLDGIVYDDVDAVADLSPEVSRAAAFELVDVLATLHAVEPTTVGLGDFGRPEGFLERQMGRWKTQWEKSKTREMANLDDLAARLSKVLPTDSRHGIVHGDYSFNNTMFRRDDRSRIRAVLDWELSTLGDPLTDVGTLTAYWGEAGEVMWRGRTPQAHRANPGFPPVEVLLDRYAAASGADLSRIDFYQAFALFKLAVISQGALRRLGDGDPERTNRTLDTVGKLTDLAAATLRGG